MSAPLRLSGSPTITRYMARLFLTRTLAVLAALVLVLMTLDLLGESGTILAHPGNGDAELWHYVALRVPQIIARFLPFSVLLGTLITFAGLNGNSEIIAMKAASVSAHQILAPFVLASLLVAGLSFAFNDRIVTRATAALNAWEAADYGRIPDRHGIESNVWVRDGEALIHVEVVSGRGAATRLGGVTLYDREGGTLAYIVEGGSGRLVPGGWLLGQVTRFDVARGVTAKLPSYLLRRRIAPERFVLADVNADERSFGALASAIRELDAAGRPTSALKAGLWHKVSAPLSAVLMPLLGAVAAFGLARSGRLFVRLVIGMGLGFAYFVADNFALEMGNLGAYPPLLAAWAPFLLFLLIGEAVLIRTEE